MKKVVRSEAHQQLALKASGEASVLLKNDGNVLPVGKGKKIALIGSLAESHYLGGYSNLQDTAVSLLTGLRMRADGGTTVRYAPGLASAGAVIKEKGQDTTGHEARLRAADQKALKAALDLVQQSDIAIVALGEDPDEVGEGKDRASLDLPVRQQQLIRAIQKTGKPIAVVLFNGRPLCINWMAEKIPAILEQWFGGEKSGLALADVLLGNTNPSGKLPVTFPRSVGQIPFYYSHKPTSYHRYVDEASTPLYPFGHGLSYTQFSYSQLELPKDSIAGTGDFKVRLRVTNTGKVAGAEVVQLYIRDLVSSVTTPVKALKGFARVSLAPGGSEEVVFSLPAMETLGLWNRQMQHVVEPGTFKVMVGSSSEDIRLNGEIQAK